jgi:hypothetical protein
MTAECDQIRVEIQRLRQELAGLDQRYMLQSERIPIYTGIAAATAAAALAQNGANAAGSRAATALGIARSALAGFQFVLGLLRAYVVRTELNALSRRIDAVEGNLDVLTRLAGVLSRRISALENRLSILEAQLLALLSRVSSIESQIRFIQTAIRFLNEAIIRIDAYLSNLDSRVRALERWRLIISAEVVALAAAIAALTATVAGLVATVAALSATVAAIGRAVAALTITVARLQAQIILALRLARSAISQAEIAIRLATLARRIAIEARGIAIDARLTARLALRRANQAIDIAITASNRADLAYSTAQFSLQLAQALRVQIIALNARIAAIQLQINGMLTLLTTIRDLLNAPVSGEIDLTPCDHPVGDAPVIVPYGGVGLAGIASAVTAAITAARVIHENTKCPSESSAALPMHFEQRPGEVPQLVIQWGPVDAQSDGGASRWSLSLPHPRDSLDHRSAYAFPAYTKGNLQFTYKLSDNSKIILNANTKDDGFVILDYLKTLVDPGFILPMQQPTITENAGQNLKIVLVRATYLQFFRGHRNQAAEWSIRLPR